MVRLTADEAARRLGVKRETLYAYVSRGLLASRRNADRTSTFDAAAVEALARRGRPRRSSHDPVIDVTVRSSLTRIERDHLTFRGVDAVSLAGTASFEQVASLLWTGTLGPFRPWPRVASSTAMSAPMLDRLRLAAAQAAIDADESLRSADPTVMTEACRSVVAAMVAAVGPVRHDRTPRLQLGGDAPHSVRDSVAARLTVRLSPGRPGPELVAAVNAALVLLTDHELAVSTLAARVAASARADGFGVIGAGFGPASGSLHGTASRSVRALLDRAEELGVMAALRSVPERRMPGFGHVLYQGADPRAVALLARVRSLPVATRRLRVVDEMLAVVRDRSGVEPNVDFALAALGLVSGMPADAGEALFVIPRTVGWVAHAIEELDEPPLRYRTRALPQASGPA